MSIANINDMRNQKISRLLCGEKMKYYLTWFQKPKKLKSLSSSSWDLSGCKTWVYHLKHNFKYSNRSLIRRQTNSIL
jgi:hypothetical protein